MEQNKNTEPVRSFGEGGPSENPEEMLRSFKEEAAAMKKAEEAAGKTAHFETMNPENLQSADLKIWRKFQDKTLTREEFEAYRDEVRHNQDSDSFAQYIANQIISWDFWPEGLQSDK